MNKLLPILGLAILAFGAGCNKKNSNPTPTKTKTELLTSQTWKIQLIEARIFVGADPGSTAYTNVTSQAGACNLDNLTIFAAAGTYEHNEGATKCNASNPQIVASGTWAFANNESRINVVSGSETKVLELISLSENQLVVTTVIPGTGGTNTQTKTTFGH